MDSIGIISVAGNPQGIALDEWTRVIAAHLNLVTVPPAEGVNPFTRAPMTYKGHPGDANVIVEGKIVGVMEWAPDDSHCIWVRGDPACVETIAADVAARLGAVFQVRTRLEEE